MAATGRQSRAFNLRWPVLTLISITTFLKPSSPPVRSPAQLRITPERVMATTLRSMPRLTASLNLAKRTLHVRLLGGALPPFSHLDNTITPINGSSAPYPEWPTPQPLL